MADNSAGPLAGLPRDARAVVLILESMGVRDFEPRVVTQLMEFSHRYIADVLTDAKAYSEHAGKSALDAEDVQLAIQSKVNTSFSQPPPRELLMEIARVRNAVPIPPIATTAGVPLPPESECLTQPNYQWATASMKAQHQQEQETRLQRTNGSKAAALMRSGSEKRAAESRDAPPENGAGGMEWEDSTGQESRPGTVGQPGTRQTATALSDDDHRQVVSFSLHQRR